MIKDQTGYNILNGGEQGGGVYVGPCFVSFVSSATSSAHVNGVRLVMVTGEEEGELACPRAITGGEVRELAYRLVILRLTCEEGEIKEDFWMG